MANKFLDITPEQAKQIEEASISTSNTTQNHEYSAKDDPYASITDDLKKSKRKEQSLQRQRDYDQQQIVNTALQPFNNPSLADGEEQWNKLWRDLNLDRGRPDPVRYVRGDDGVFRADDKGLSKFIAMDAKRQAVGNVLDAVYANGQSVEEYKGVLDRARALNINPSQLLDADPETNKSIDKTIERGSIKIANLDTPVTLDIYTNYNVASLGRDSIQNTQLMEWKLSNLRTDERLEAEYKARLNQPTGFGDNFYYGFRKNSLFLQSAIYWVADFLEYGGHYSADRRNDKLASTAVTVEGLKKDQRIGQIAEEYDKNGFLGAAGYTASNLGMIPSMLAQFAPSLAFGGAGGKGGSLIMSRLLANKVLSTGAKDYLMYASAMAPTIGTATTLGSYSGNLAQSYQSTGDAGEAVKRARTRTAIEAGTDTLFSLIPLPTQLASSIRATRAGNIANVLTTTVAQSASAGIGTYAGAKAAGEKVTEGEIFTNIFMNAVFAPIELATATRTGGRDFSPKAAAKRQAILSTVDDLKESPLAKRDIETAKEVFKGLHTAYNKGNPKEVFVSPENFTRFFQEQGVDPNEIAKQVTGKDDALEQATTTGTDLVIPIEQYAELEANGYVGLRDDVKTEVDGVTLREHNQFVEKNRQRAEQLVNDAVETANKVVADLENNPIYSNIKEQLLGVGRITKTAEAEASIFYSAFDNIAKRAGLDANELFNRYNLKITKDGVINNHESITRFAQTGDPKEFFKPAQQEADTYRANLDKAVNSSVSRNIEIELGNTPLALQAVGAPDLKVRITRDTVRKAINKVKHDVSMDTIKNLPELLNDPIAIFKSNTESDALVVLVDARDESNRPVIAAVHLNFKEKRNALVNRIASVYGKDNIKNFINRELKNNNLLYHRNKKSLDLVRSDGLQLPVDGSPSKGLKNNVLNADDVVKLYQTTDKEVNGFIEIVKDGSVRINLNDTENRTTFIHEAGHFFLNMLSDIENMGVGNDNIKSVNNTFKKWLKADDLRSLTIGQHEQFARGFEAYLFEGKAPSIELRGAFKLVKQWMRSVYKMLSMLNVKLNNDVRQAFDRILASDEAIKLAEAYNQELFTTAERMGVSQKEFDAYQEIQRQAHDEAEEKLTIKALKEITREKTTQWKEESRQVKEQVTNDFQENNNLYVLDDFLTRGVISEDGNKVIQKLDRDTIKEIYGDEIAEQLKRFTQKDGLNPDDTAKQFNFSSTDEMVQQLASKPSNKDMINAETKRIMLNRHGDMLNDGTIEQLAIEAVQTDEAKAKLLHAEELAIRKQALLVNRVNKAKSSDIKEAKKAAYANIAPDSLLREISDQTVSTTKITDLKPDLYLQGMRKANREAVKAVDKGDWEGAAKAKEQERLNYHLYKNALRGVRSADAAYSFVKKLNRKTTREMINKSSPEALEQIDRLTEQYQFKKVSDKEITFRQNLRSYLDILESEGRAIDVPDFILDNHLSTNYRELTVEQLQGLHDTLKGMVNVARLQNKLIAEGKAIDFKEFKEEAINSIQVNNPVNATGKATSKLSETKADQVADEINKFNANMADIATICQRLDGGDAGGIMSMRLYKPLLNAELKMRGMTKKYQQRINDILAKQDGTYFKQKTTINSLGGRMIAKGEAIMIALNSGNASNKSRLLTGGLKTKESVRAIPLTDQAISEVLGTLTKQDWELVKGIWQMFEDMKPETKELYRTLNGSEFKEVEVGTIQTQYGEIKGGYFPLMYDRDVAIVPDGVQKQTVFKEGRTSALTNNGYTKARAEKVTGTLNLNLDIFPTKLNEHILDLTHRKALIDANKILTNPEISTAIKEKMGANYYNSLFQSIYSLANPDNSKGIGAWASALAKNTAVYQLGFSLKTVINQYAGAFQLLKYVNAVDYVSEIANVAGGNYASTLAHIKELSPVMADRWASMDLSHSALSKLEGKGKIAVGHENLQTIALAFMPVCERTFSVPAWMAIYKRELASGKTSEQAVMVADAAIVKSQGGFLNINKSAIQRNKAITPFMMFASPFIAAYNGFVDSAHAVKQGKSSLLRETMTNLAVVSLAGFGYSLMTGQKDDDEGYAKFYLKSSLSYATAGIPFVRDIVNFAVDAKGRSAMSTPIASTITNLVSQGKKLTTNPSKAKAEMVVGAGAAVTGTPLKPIVVQGAAIKDLATGDYKPTDFLDGVRHILYRKNKPK